MSFMREPPDDESVRRIERVELLIRRLGAANTMADAAALIARFLPDIAGGGSATLFQTGSDGRLPADAPELAFAAQIEGTARPADHWSIVALPLRAGDRSLGVVLVRSPGSRTLVDEERQLLFLFAEHAGSALRRLEPAPGKPASPAAEAQAG
jgi:hypothetical protein